MSRGFEVLGWEDYDGNRRVMPTDAADDERYMPEPNEAYGALVHVYDPDDPEADHYFWAWVGGPFQTWDEWNVYIDSMMDMYTVDGEWIS